MTNEPPTRYAIVGVGPALKDTVARYLPGNYAVVGTGILDGRDVVIIAGNDSAGWTLDDYVLPRLASGLYFGREITQGERGTLGCAVECPYCHAEPMEDQTGPSHTWCGCDEAEAEHKTQVSA